MNHMTVFYFTADLLLLLVLLGLCYNAEVVARFVSTKKSESERTHCLMCRSDPPMVCLSIKSILVWPREGCGFKG